ncbi:fumarylacetoacetate hydrolase family protein [Cohnella thailandensis]|uniref:Fumarylacetoacetate hydrolase family protein n=1 Tax=Cohnella thailandensis TaxID=557557 RepID=A0A841T0W0_9BACL|nr:fumarylacetoacetate hydrolase family protein [Cohnella thailandensis]MBB6636496.1 fumarylacetoacetate hydrolase family protein [Cohnella thailandensis]MBP1977632.1 2-keto-4-pentenoate hydratase/2-oxohepta-3-ene-1,7-dioic acid hydratase in catechol pathway [Cohnella thailandensis]
MRIVTLAKSGEEVSAIRTAGGYVTLRDIRMHGGGDWPDHLATILSEGRYDDLRDWYEEGGGRSFVEGLTALPEDAAEYAPLYRNPSKIWGIGMNYGDKPPLANSLSPDEEPVGFMKPTTALCGMQEAIKLPEEAGTITAEAELAIVIGRKCRNVGEAEAPSCVAGFAAVLDVTAADIHSRNPRFLTRAKSYDTFFGFGPELVSPDEIPDILELEVSTVLNGVTVHRNRVVNMRYRPWYAVAFHSRFMTLLPGDILMTGTPGAVVIRSGDRADCRIEGFLPLSQRVI